MDDFIKTINDDDIVNVVEESSNSEDDEVIILDLLINFAIKTELKANRLNSLFIAHNMLFISSIYYLLDECWDLKSSGVCLSFITFLYKLTFTD